MAAATTDPTPAAERGRLAVVPGWDAELTLGFRVQRGRTILARRQHTGPLRVQRPFHPEAAGPCQVVILHPPGGVVGGDRLTLKVEAEPGAKALLTAPGARKLYRSAGRRAVVYSQLRAQPRASIEWLPQETLVFDAADADVTTRVDLAADARFMGWEVIGLGLPALQRPFRSGRCASAFELWREDEPVWMDRSQLRGGDECLRADWRLAGRAVAPTRRSAKTRRSTWKPSPK